MGPALIEIPHSNLPPSFAYASGTDHTALKIEPFTPNADSSVSGANEPGALSSKAAQARQEYLRNQLRTVQWQLQALEGVAGSASASSVPSESVSASETDSAGLQQARQQNEALQERIRALEGQLNSRWALGLSDEPPPGYMD